MLRKLLGSLLLGLSLVGLVGCGAAPETTTEVQEPVAIESVLAKGEQVVELLKHDEEITEKWERNELTEDSELYFSVSEEETINKEIDTYTYEMLLHIKSGTGEKKLSEISERDLKEYEEEFSLMIELGTNDVTEKLSANSNPEDKVKVTVIDEETGKEEPIFGADESVAKEAPVEQTKKESQYLVDVINKSEAYTWEMYDIITKGGDLGRIETICADMIEALEGVRMEDCEYEGEFYAVQNLHDAYLNMVTTVGPATMHGIDVSADLPAAYTKINNETLFLLNELNN